MEYDKEYGFLKIKSKPNFHLVIANSNIEHSTEVIVKNVKSFKENNENEFSNLCHSEQELIKDVLKLLEKNEIKELGEKVNQNQKYLEVIGISNDKIRKMVEIGNESSYGTKITGAGGGGCVFALTDNVNLDKTINQFKEKNYECFSVKIDFQGLNTF